MKTCPTCQTSYPDSYQVCPKDSASLASWGVWKDGNVVRGKYRILEALGHGGMADVYKALHVTFGEVRALKVMNVDLLRDELFVKRFKQEAVLCRKLQHPNAVQVDDIDEAEDGRPFIVMEYVEGRSLREVIQSEAPMPVARVCRITRQVASALDAAHRLGMVHRDIKPANILVASRPEGEQAKVLDFGIAKLRESRASETTAGMTLTGPGLVVGTPPYMSPEQALGKRGDEIDGRSDLYSLGIVMYQMLTGELPFATETTVATLLAHIQALPAPLLGRYGLKIPEPVASVVMQCLEKKPEARPASAKVLIEDLERAEQEAEVSVPAAATVGISDNRLAEVTGNKRTDEQVMPVATPAVSEAALPTPAAAPAEPQSNGRLPPDPPRSEPSSAATSGGPAAAIAAAPMASNQAADSATVSRKRSSGLGLTMLVAVLLAGGSWYAYRRYYVRRILPSPEATVPAGPNASSTSPPVTAGPAANPVPATTTAPAERAAGSTEPASPTLAPPLTTPSTSVGNGGAAGKKPAVPTKTAQVSAHSRKASTPAQGKTIRALEVGTPPAAAAAVPPVSTAAAPTTSAEAAKPARNPMLNVSSTPPGADVYVDNKWVGKTAPDGTLALAHIAPGTHSVRMVHAGYQDENENITLPPGASTGTSAKLTPVGASYRVSHDHFRGSTPGMLTVRDGRIRFEPDKGKDSFDVKCADVKEVGQEESGFYFKARGKKYSFKSDLPAVVVETIRQATGLGSHHVS
jgi:eukaryotic-like serine/threonine-protein kinase